MLNDQTTEEPDAAKVARPVLKSGGRGDPFADCNWLAAVAWRLPAFAICGTHFPSGRLPALSEALAVYGVFDPDRAGRSAAERFAPLFGSRWRPVRLPNSLDLAELAALGAAGRETFDIVVGRARAAAWQQSRV
jgi:DNA primase